MPGRLAAARFTRRRPLAHGASGVRMARNSSKGAFMSMQRIVPGEVVSRIWEIYRDQFSVLAGTAFILCALQFVVYLLLPAVLGIVVEVLFLVLAILYQGMVVKLVQDVQDGRRDNSIPELLRSVEP